MGTAARGPVGQPREPWLVVVLAVVTLGIYTLYYWWVVSREADEHDPRAERAHGLVKIGVVLSILAVLLALVLFAAFFAGVFAAAVTPGEPDPAALVGAIMGGIFSFLVVFGLGMAGSVLLLVGKWRVWKTIEASEKTRQHATPLSPTLMLVLTIASFVVPFVGFVLPLVVLYMTQDHLNQMWASA